MGTSKSSLSLYIALQSPHRTCLSSANYTFILLPPLTNIADMFVGLLLHGRDVMVREGYKYDGLYDWVKRKRAEAAVKDPVVGLKDASRSDRHRRPSDRPRDRDRSDRARRDGDRARRDGDRAR